MYRLFWEPFCKAGNAFEHIQHVSMDRLCMREQQMEHYARFIMHAVITQQTLWRWTSAGTKQTNLNTKLGFKNKCTHLGSDELKSVSSVDFPVCRKKGNIFIQINVD